MTHLEAELPSRSRTQQFGLSTGHPWSWRSRTIGWQCERDLGRTISSSRDELFGRPADRIGDVGDGKVADLGSLAGRARDGYVDLELITLISVGSRTSHVGSRVDIVGCIRLLVVIAASDTGAVERAVDP